MKKAETHLPSLVQEDCDGVLHGCSRREKIRVLSARGRSGASAPPVAAPLLGRRRAHRGTPRQPPSPPGAGRCQRRPSACRGAAARRAAGEEMSADNVARQGMSHHAPWSKRTLRQAGLIGGEALQITFLNLCRTRASSAAPVRSSPRILSGRAPAALARHISVWRALRLLPARSNVAPPSRTKASAISWRRQTQRGRSASRPRAYARNARELWSCRRKTREPVSSPSRMKLTTFATASVLRSLSAHSATARPDTPPEESQHWPAKWPPPTKPEE